MGNIESVTGAVTRKFSREILPQSPKLPCLPRKQSVLINDDAIKNGKSPVERSSRASSFRSHSEQRSFSKEKCPTESSSTSPLSTKLRISMDMRVCVGEKWPSPQFPITGDLRSHQITLIRRTWKQQLKKHNDDEHEMATRLLLRIFLIEPRLRGFFYLSDVPYNELRSSYIFQQHVKAIEPTLSFVMKHLHDPTSMSGHLQMLGGRHLAYTTVPYKSIYWKIIVQAIMEFVHADSEACVVRDAWIVLGGFCTEQMRIGFKIEYKLWKVANEWRKIQ
ncbi:unnamed protein product [Dracunculus medinensis]|uniref:GLOBIN domain-containing protein n=1 Tax=Dracunculus medinensis TaxID=318479 RepID=A0A0N4U1B7_DRAME|nr:unnamed protein product [Dracunculus medinensis]